MNDPTPRPHAQLPRPSSAHAFVFAEFRLEPANATVTRDGHAVPMTPKAFSVLEYLAQHAGRLVTKDEFMERLWPGVFVGDAALKVCVREIRRALGDDPHEPRFVETAHRRGYRFIAPVQMVEALLGDAPLVAATVAHPAVATMPPASGPATTGSVESRAAVDLVPVPQTRYARSGDVNIAYQVVGDGPIDLVFVMGWVSHLDYFWREPSFARFLTRLASFSRLILFDKRGTGMSDRVGELPTLEQRMDDVRAVLEAAGSRQAALLGVSEGGPLCTLYATTYPERTLALVMIGSYAKRRWAPDYPWAPTEAQRERFFEEIRQSWGGPVGIDVRAPSRASDPAFREWWSTYLRMGASPGAALALTKMNAEIDIRHLLPAVRVPTLIVHRTDDRCLTIEEGRLLAERIPGATMVELPGDDHLPFVGDQDSMLDAIERFLEGRHEAVDAHRVLATIVTAQVTDAGSSATDRALFEAHVQKEVDWYRGRSLEVSRERLQAAFDGPARAVRCATAIAAAASRFKLRLQVGLHTGECEVDGVRMRGAAVALSARLSAFAELDEVLVSRTVMDLVAGSGLQFDARGVRQLADDGSAWTVFAAARRHETLTVS